MAINAKPLAAKLVTAITAVWVIALFVWGFLAYIVVSVGPLGPVDGLRRTAVRNLERAGVSRSVAMKLTGHKTEAVYRRYAITSAADLSEGVAKLASLHSASAGPRSVLPITMGTVRAQSGA